MFPCQGDPELFFPVAEEGTVAFDQQAARAQALCAVCPVRSACLGYALETGQDHGIWGGATPAQRRVLRRTAFVPSIA